MNGTILVEKIDLILKEKNLKRQNLAEYCSITPQAISDWSKKGGLPSAVIALKIAEFLDVSIYWLFHDGYEIQWNEYIDEVGLSGIRLSPKELMLRIDDLLCEKNGKTPVRDGIFYSDILDIINMNQIRSFKSNRAEPTIIQLFLLSQRLLVSLDQLIIGKKSFNNPDANNWHYQLAQKYPYHLMNFHSLKEEEQEIVSNLTSTLFKRRRQIRESLLNHNIDISTNPELNQIL